MANHHEEGKIRVLVIAKMINDGERLTATEIQRRLEQQYNIYATTKTIRSDLHAIGKMIPIDASPGWNGGFKKCDVGRAEDGK